MVGTTNCRRSHYRWWDIQTVEGATADGGYKQQGELLQMVGCVECRGTTDNR